MSDEINRCCCRLSLIMVIFCGLAIQLSRHLDYGLALKDAR
jgi:hypothetical protein